MKLICTVGLAIVVLLFAAACAEPQGPAGPQGPVGSPGLAGVAYSPELYDDCRDAFGSFSVASLRRMMATSGDVAELGELGVLTDDDVRSLLKMACLVMASGADTFLGSLVEEAMTQGQ